MTATNNHTPLPATILVIDIGGSKVKILATGETTPRTRQSGKRLIPTQLVAAVHELAEGWTYEAISIGYPGVVGGCGPRSEPGNLGSGWVGCNFAAAFGCPVTLPPFLDKPGSRLSTGRCQNPIHLRRHATQYCPVSPRVMLPKHSGRC